MHYSLCVMTVLSNITFSEIRCKLLVYHGSLYTKSCYAGPCYNGPLEYYIHRKHYMCFCYIMSLKSNIVKMKMLVEQFGTFCYLAFNLAQKTYKSCTCHLNPLSVLYGVLKQVMTGKPFISHCCIYTRYPMKCRCQFNATRCVTPAL